MLNRSLAPHLYIYKTHITSIMSIFHRITGSLSSIILLCYSFFLSLISCFLSNNNLYFLYNLFFILTNIFSALILFIFFFHFFNGIRHILWDFGIGLNIFNVIVTGFLTFFISFFSICLLIVL